MRDNVNQPIAPEVNRPNVSGAKRILGPWVDQAGRLDAARAKFGKPRMMSGIHKRGKAIRRLKSRKMT